MLLKRWEPFTDLTRMEREIDSLWGRMLRPHHFRPRLLTVDGHVDLDVYHSDDALVVKAAIPGVKPEDMEIDITENVLTIKGEIKADQDVDEDKLLHHECRYGAFRRVVSLPRSLNTDKAEASYDSGVFTITIPKEEEAKPKSLKVKVTVDKPSKK